MEAPDKIYITVRPSQIANGFVYTTCSNDCPDAKAYIRKDALLEWAESELESITGNFGLAEGGRIALGVLINKLNLM